jgi:hypothetical protein
MENPWTSEEETMLIVMCPYMDVVHLSEHINRSPLAISFRLVKLGMENSIKNVNGFNTNWIRRCRKPEIFSITKLTLFFK